MNALSPKLAGKFQISATVIKLIPITLMAVVGTLVGLFNGTLTTNFTTVVSQAVGGTTGSGLFAAVVATVFAYEGWIVATSINAELKNAKKNLPPKADKAEQEKAKLPALNVTFPAVKRTFKTIAWRYEVTAEREDGSAAAKKRILAEDFHLPTGSQKKCYAISFLRSQLPASGKIRFSVTPYDCFGNAGRAIVSNAVTL
jgi:hypothetical protein